MSQPRLHSLSEAVVNNIVSFGVAFILNLIVIPKLREMSPAHAALVLTSIFTVISVIRQYILRRLFNWWHVKSLVNQKP